MEFLLLRGAPPGRLRGACSARPAATSSGLASPWSASAPPSRSSPPRGTAQRTRAALRPAGRRTRGPPA
eukprot:9811018-Alexandrium_andersonii.AAC.1